MKKSTIFWIVLFIIGLAFCYYTVYVEPQVRTGDDITETVTVLYAEHDGFITELSQGYCYVEYPNADKVVSVGDRVELSYNTKDLIIALPDEGRGGYTWTTALLEVADLVVK